MALIAYFYLFVSWSFAKKSSDLRDDDCLWVCLSILSVDECALEVDARGSNDKMGGYVDVCYGG